MTVGLLHAQCLRRVVGAGLDDHEALARTWDRVTEEQVSPFYWNQIRADRARKREIDALCRGVDPPPPDPADAAMFAAMTRDPDVFRAMLEIAMCLARRDEVLARPGFMEKVGTAPAGRPMRIPGPNRQALLALLS